MELSVEQIKERIKNPVNRQPIQDAKDHEDRIKLHTKAVDKKEKASAYFPRFLNWVKTGVKLPADKCDAFEGMCQFPLLTTATCNSIFEEYQKIFEAQDHYFDVELLDDSLKAEFKDYLKRIHVHNFFKTQGFDDYKTQPAVIYVVDLPAVQTTDRPQPYINEVAISQVIDIGAEKTVDNKDRIGYLIYKVSDMRVVAIDDFSYRLLEKQKEGEDHMVIVDSRHNLGYTPATFLVQNALYKKEDKSPVARKVMLSNSLFDLDWLLFYMVAERMYETYGPFPITTVPETHCNYTDKLGNTCDGGFIPSTKPDGTPWHYECPVCAKNNLVGPGTIFTKPIPRSKEDPTLEKPVEITPADVPSLEYITTKIEKLKAELKKNNVGGSDETVTKEAVNEKQVQTTVEGKRNVLCLVKTDFECAEKFIVDTMGRLMYGDYYVNCTVNYGEQFLLFTATDLIEQYANEKKAGLPNYLVNQTKELLTQTKYKNNPYQRQRAETLKQLEPWPDKSDTECIAIQYHLIFPEKFLLKTDFANFVSKFERANGDIVQWGSALSLDKKIERLTEILLKYATTEQQSAKPLPEPAGATKEK
jgi:hypothetical protein